jgi:hypothetical protein
MRGGLQRLTLVYKDFVANNLQWVACLTHVVAP